MRSVALLFLLVLICQNPAAGAESRSLDVFVVRIIDGDTAVAIDSNKFEHRLRLAGIDAPEKEQAFSDRSRRHLGELIHNKSVRIEWSKVDRYGRLIAKITILNADDCADLPCTKSPTDVNLEQIRAGLAWHYKEYEAEQSPRDRREYSAAEKVARDKRLGLWVDHDPAAPWEQRHGSVSLVDSSTQPVKKSRNDICHDASMSSYQTVKHFVSFTSLEACVASGGRLPKSVSR